MKYHGFTKEGTSLAKKNISTKIEKRNRLIVVYFGLGFIFLLLISRLFYLMAFTPEKIIKATTQQWTSDIVLDAKRGNVLDRNGHELAVSADVYRVDLDLLALKQTLKKSNMTNEELEQKYDELAEKLASILDMKLEDVQKAFDRTLDDGIPASWAPLKRKVEKPQADEIKALKIFGILVSSDSKRYYPRGNFLSHVIGHVNEQGSGAGIEQEYNKELSGEAGRIIYERDSKSNQLFFENSRYTTPVDGKSVMLTIDEVIQDYVEKAAEKAMTENKALGVSIMVMNPKNGEILAMVNKPDFDLNTPYSGGKTSEELQKIWTNRSVQFSFEPGSIFKPITAAAAMEYGTSKETDKFICKGSTLVANQRLFCANRSGHGTQDFIDILKNSCNVGFIEVGQKLGKENLYNFTRKLGFGEKTGIDLPGEEAGIMRTPKDINEVELATISYGQGIAVTQVQYLKAFNALANGGTLITPHVMKNIVSYNSDGKITVERSYDDLNEKQVLDSKLTTNLRRYLEKVVSEGAGSNAYVKDLHIAGKTGTAQKYENGKIKSKAYISSFAGMAPFEDPKITLIVTIDEPDPSKYYAGQVSAPIAKELFTSIFNYITINPKVLE